MKVHDRRNTACLSKPQFLQLSRLGEPSEVSILLDASPVAQTAVGVTSAEGQIFAMLHQARLPPLLPILISWVRLAAQLSTQLR